MCDRLAMIRDGKIIGTGTPAGIVSGYPYRLLAVEGKRMYPMLKILRAAEGVISCFSFGNSHHLAYDPAKTGKEALLKTMHAAGFDDCSVREIVPGIEDCFMQLAGK